MDCKTATNSTYAIGGVSFYADSFVVAESFVLRMNICAENPTHRKSAKRQDVKKPILENFASRNDSITMTLYDL
nr:hypothetical protein [Bacteroidota bacterium]